MKVNARENDGPVASKSNVGYTSSIGYINKIKWEQDHDGLLETDSVLIDKINMLILAVEQLMKPKQ